MSTSKPLRKAPVVWYLWRLVMLGSTLLMGGILIMGGIIQGANGTGLFGVPVSATEQAVGQLWWLSGVVLLVLALCMLRRVVKPIVVVALLIVGVDVAAYMFVEQGSGPMFGITYGLVMAVAFSMSRHLIR